MRTINIPPALIDDFKSHIGWWAVIDDPGLEKGEQFQFDLGGTGVFVDAILLHCGKLPQVLVQEKLQHLRSSPDDTKPIVDKEIVISENLVPRTFENWFIIQYVPWIEEEVCDCPECQLRRG